MKILSIDPGKKSGWVIINTRAAFPMETFGVAQFEDFGKLLEEFTDVDFVVYEDYKIRPGTMQRGWNHQWDSGLALQVIGMIKKWAEDYSIPIAVQQPAIKPAAAKLTGIPYTKGKANMHHMDAMLHGMYFLIKNKYMTPDRFRARVK